MAQLERLAKMLPVNVVVSLKAMDLVSLLTATSMRQCPLMAHPESRTNTREKGKFSPPMRMCKTNKNTSVGSNQTCGEHSDLLNQKAGVTGVTIQQVGKNRGTERICMMYHSPTSRKKKTMQRKKEMQPKSKRGNF